MTTDTAVASATDIIALEDRRLAAMIAVDTDALDELLADSLFYTHSNGARDTKATFIESLTSGQLKYRAVHRLEHDVALYPGAAVIAAKVRLEITAGGVDRTINAKATITWVNTPTGWKFGAWQSTPLPA